MKCRSARNPAHAKQELRRETIQAREAFRCCARLPAMPLILILVILLLLFGGGGFYMGPGVGYYGGGGISLVLLLVILYLLFGRGRTSL